MFFVLALCLEAVCGLIEVCKIIALVLDAVFVPNMI